MLDGKKRCLVFCINITETINTFLHLCRAITVLALLNGVQGYKFVFYVTNVLSSCGVLIWKCVGDWRE